ncbi:MAG: hypothetical protein ACREBD_30705 [Blastocatellia bacterium]
MRRKRRHVAQAAALPRQQNRADGLFHGANNSFFGHSAGLSNTTAHGNSFFGASAGELTATGIENAFFGLGAGTANTIPP